MNYLSDLHTHTIVSGHAYNTLTENINYCAEHGIKILGTSEHAPTMPGAPHQWYFGNLKILPRYINGVMLLKGCEVNILNVNGDIDLSHYEYRNLDYLIASLHEPCFAPNTKEENTLAVLNAIDNNPGIEILGHMGNPNYPLDYEAIVRKSKEKDIIIEFNSSSIAGSSRPGSKANCTELAKLCNEIGTKVIMSSDAHYCTYIGKFDSIIEMFKEVNMKEELIMNVPERLINHLKSKGKLQDL